MIVHYAACCFHLLKHLKATVQKYTRKKIASLLFPMTFPTNYFLLLGQSHGKFEAISTQLSYCHALLF